MGNTHTNTEPLTDVHNELRRLKKYCRKHSAFEAIVLKVITVCITIVFPLYEAFFFSILKDSTFLFSGQTNPPIPFGLLDSLTILVFILHVSFTAIYLVFSGRADLRKYVELNSCIEHIDQVVKEKEQIKDVYTTLYKTMDTFRDISTKKQECLALVKAGKTVGFEDELGHILSKFCSTIPSVFEFDGNIRYNFSIYILDIDSMSLKCEFRSRDTHSEEVRNHLSRTWGQGQGHIGKCFSNAVSYVDSDITQDPMFPYTNNAPDDKKFYRSAISIPLRSIDTCRDRKHCERVVYGVMLMTCSLPDRLTELHLEIMISLQMLLEEFIFTLWEASNDNAEKLSE